ncbi:putative replication associated protein [Monocercomonoides exilis]|nr:putative replication associated protein [Monocercomonoides exilis]|eukprot:MONOS_16101.1-p1 / transcript=MONOS_16101.1 / gene=MONOS_16101 / organism=Monocercomonoides_exilis_PA203 / gene_product=replication-associated protein / transcript_product=replication-associated protein / location=Mono_scaffold01505:5604-6389(-) / protein_length=261 / sequence_SO=supercontig / SO=protein_coding / is_pseudo=false
MFPIRTHLEPAHGSPQQNIDYCTKQGNWKEFGERPQPGKRTDLARVAQKVVEGTKVSDLAKEEPEITTKYYKGLTFLQAQVNWDKRGQREKRRHTYWIWGASGTGKTYFSCEQLKKMPGYRKSEFYMWPKSKDFIDAYQGEKYALFDDFRAEGSMDFDTWLRLCDPWMNPTISIKGASATWSPDVIFFTSIMPPETCWLSQKKLSAEDTNQIRRRVHVIDIADCDVHIPEVPDDEPELVQHALMMLVTNMSINTDLDLSHQ